MSSPTPACKPPSRFPRLVCVRNLRVRLEHAKREIVAAEFYEIPAEAVAIAGQTGR